MTKSLQALSSTASLPSSSLDAVEAKPVTNPEPRVEWARSKRPFPARPTQDEYLALCLVMLARGGDCSTERPPPERCYSCSICGKRFPSHQALGGHKSSHRRTVDGDIAVPPVTSISSDGSGISSGSGRAHECNVCHRVFGTGQALGGHKRRHYLENSSASSGLASSGLRDFDLNLPALTEFGFKWWTEVEEEDEVQSPLPSKKLRLVVTG